MTKTITKLKIDGGASITFDGKQFKADSEIEGSISGNTLSISSLPGITINSTGGSIVYGNGRTQIGFNNSMTINGNTYQVNSGSNQTIIQNVGHGNTVIQTNDAIWVNGKKITSEILSKLPESDEKEKKSKGSCVYTLDSVELALTSIDLCGAVTLQLNAKHLGAGCDIDTSGASKLELVGDEKFTNLQVQTSGASKVSGHSIYVKKLKVKSSGASSIKGFTATEDCVAKASGASKIDVIAVRGCDVDKNSSGCANIRVSKI